MLRPNEGYVLVEQIKKEAVNGIILPDTDSELAKVLAIGPKKEDCCKSSGGGRTPCFSVGDTVVCIGASHPVEDEGKQLFIIKSENILAAK